jgi:hypothetical protein
MQPILQNHTLVQHQWTVGWRLVSTLLLFLLVMFWGLVQAVEDSDYQLSAAGPAVTVHDNTAGEQQGPQSIRLADGGMLVVFWQRIQPDPEVREYDVEITAQPYDSSGNRAGAPIAVVERARHEYNLSEPYTLSAAALSNGGYVIAWRDLGSNQVSMRVYDASHQLVNDQVEIGPLPKRTVRHKYSGDIEVDVLPQQVPVLTAVEDGGFVATFSAYHPQHRNLSEIFHLGGVTAYAQAFTADGQPKSEALQIRPWLDSTLGVSYNWNKWKNWVQDSAALPDGRHVVVFDLGSDQPDNPLENDAIMVRFFDADGVPVSDGFIVNQSNTYYKNYRQSTTVAALAGGRFVVAWEDNGEMVWWRLYNAQGSALNEQQRMGEDRYIDPIVNPMPDGGFLLTARRYISSPYGAYADDAYAQRIDADENLVSDVFKVIDAGDDLDRASARVAPAVLWLGDGSIWSVVQATNRDDQGNDVVMLPMIETPLDDGYALSVSTLGHGILSSTPAGIDCGTTCTANFPANTQVTLTAVADSGYRLDSWGGACAATPASSNRCTLTMDAAQSVSVTFAETTTPNVTLSVSVAGPGLVIGDGIECPNDCTASYAQGDIITLTATPIAGATFTGWGGACAAGSDAPICILTMDQARNVTATFETGTGGNDTQILMVSIEGSGSVSSSPPNEMDCSSFIDHFNPINSDDWQICEAEWEAGTQITLTATAAAGSVFTGWSDDCTGNSVTCALTMDQERFVTAVFEQGVVDDEQSLSVGVTGPGVVTSAPAGIHCGDTCRANYPIGTEVTLTATSEDGARFTGWSGACTGTALTCTLTINQARNVSARFANLAPSGTVTHYFDSRDNTALLTDTANAQTRYIDFGGNDTFTLAPEILGPMTLIDNQATTIHLPAGLSIEGSEFLSDGVRLTVNGHSVTLLGTPELFSFVFAGDPLDETAGITRSYSETAEILGARIPNSGESAILGTETGTIQSDGSFGSALDWPTTETIIEEGMLAPRDTSLISSNLENRLAEAVKKANEADFQTKVFFNAFFSANPQTSRDELLNTYRAMTKSFEIASRMNAEVVAVHKEIEDLLDQQNGTNDDDDNGEIILFSSSTDTLNQGKELLHASNSLNVNGKLQWYLDNFGKTTPGGNRINIATIAERNQISHEKVHVLLNTQYSVISEQATSDAILYEAGEKIAEEIKVASDRAGTMLSMVSGAQSVYGAYKTYNTANAAVRMWLAGSLKDKTVAQIMKKQTYNLITGAVDAGFNFTGASLGLLTDSAIKKKLSPEFLGNVKIANELFGLFNIAKSLTFDATTIFSVKDAFTGNSKLLINDLTSLINIGAGTARTMINFSQDKNGMFQYALGLVGDGLTGEVRFDQMMRERLANLSHENMLPNGGYVVVDDENNNEENVTVSSSGVNTLLSDLEEEDRLLDDSGDVIWIDDLIDDPDQPLIAGRYQVKGTNDEIIRDTVTGLEWQRCLQGENWDARNEICDDESPTIAKRHRWNRLDEVTADGGFRVPTIDELRTLVYCSNTGNFGMQEDRKSCGDYRTYQSPTIVTEAFPQGSHHRKWDYFLWSISAYNQWNAYGVRFGDGMVVGVDDDGYHPVRLVR